MTTSIPTLDDPSFSRSEVARVLNVTALTIRNRERAGKYPQPRRDMNDHRIYNLVELMELQVLTFGSVDPKPIVSMLYDKGYRNFKEVSTMLDAALEKRTGTVNAE